jgi:hypothetical protein
VDGRIEGLILIKCLVILVTNCRIFVRVYHDISFTNNAVNVPYIVSELFSLVMRVQNKSHFTIIRS